MTKTILNSIKSYKLAEIASRKLNYPLSKLEVLARDVEPVRGFTNKLIVSR